LPTITEQPTPLVPQRRQDTFGESICVGRLVDVNRVVNNFRRGVDCSIVK